MSALTERLIASRDMLKLLNIGKYEPIREARGAMAEAANALSLLEELAKAALDINSYAGHDEDCLMRRQFQRYCACGYTAANQRVIELAERVVEVVK